MTNILKAPDYWSYDLTYFGDENSPVLIIDNFVQSPNDVVAHAALQDFQPLARYYPGVRAAAPIQYLQPVLPALSEALVTIFGLTRGVTVQECFFSLVTTPPEQLVPMQRHPHIDGGDDGKIAILHYLCGPEHGGTAFYRQRRTGFETVPNERFAAYKTALETDVQTYGLPPKDYFYESDEKFEKIFDVPAQYNRTIIYRSINLHSVNVGPNPTFSREPKTGRLTTNIFINPLVDAAQG